MQTRYPIRAVAKITGLSLDTLRAWERRYQAVVPERSGRGRQYGLAQIDRLILLNTLVQRGHAIGGIASLTDQQLKRLIEAEPQSATVSQEPAADLLAPVLAALENYDAARAGDELSRLAAVLAPRDLVYQVVVPLMQQVGDRWHNGTLAVAQEHLVSQILRNLLGAMVRLLRPANPALKIVLATPSGEAHEFGILAAAMLAALHGFEPVYLGPDLPAAEIAEAARRLSAGIILIGISIAASEVEAELQALAQAMPEACELWAGGAGVPDLSWSRLARKTVRLASLADFESECRRRRNP